MQSGLVTLKPLITFDRHFVDSSQMACISNSWFAYIVFARMDAAATIIFRSGKMQRLFKGGYHSRYAYVCINSMHQGSRSIAILRGRANNNLQLGRIVECSLLLYRGSSHSQSFVPYLRTCSCRRCAPDNYEMQCLFETYLFDLLDLSTI